MPSWLITAADRGIDYNTKTCSRTKKFRRHYRSQCRLARASSVAAKHLKSLKVVELGITSQESVDECRNPHASPP
ncbi:hypothetical protein BDZ97DRAFT_1930297 [Flammula alnicola]|nr:hypothetical protein BDZ97DRAFT_1930297 [Flammula alnicola]